VTGSTSGYVARTHQVVPTANRVNFSMHREGLVAKKMSEEMKNVSHDVLKTVNLIKARPINSKLFRILREKI
jgi:hypothetical protein